MAKLVYFDFPGKAEASRLIIKLGNLPVQDAPFAQGEWPTIKPTTPFGQVPVLIHEDGSMLAQSTAIERYLAKQANLLPTGDDWEVAQADSIYCFMNDIWDLFAKTFSIQDADAKVKARLEIVAGPLPEKLNKLAAAYEGKQYIAGGKLSYVDLYVFVQLSVLSSGWLDGVPKDALKVYPTLVKVHDTIASLPGIKERYESATEGMKLGFKPLNL